MTSKGIDDGRTGRIGHHRLDCQAHGHRAPERDEDHAGDGVPRYEFTPKCVRYPKSAVEAAIAASYRPASAGNE